MTDNKFAWSNIINFAWAERAIIEVKGVESAKFLQSITTNNIYLLKNGELAYNLFLNRRGKVIFDCFIYKHNGENLLREALPSGISNELHQEEQVFYLDCQADQVDKLLIYLHRYKLTSKVTVTLRPELAVLLAYDANYLAYLSQLLEKNCKQFIVAGDPRSLDLGWRLLLRDKDQRQQNATYNYAAAGELRYSGHGVEEAEKNDLAPNTGEGYNILRGLTQRFELDYADYLWQIFKILRKSWENNIVYAVLDWDSEQFFAFDLKLAEIGAISLNKGCYIGQEMVTRTEFLGEARRELFKIFRADKFGYYFIFKQIEQQQKFSLFIWDYFESIYKKLLNDMKILNEKTIDKIWQESLEASLQEDYEDIYREFWNKNSFNDLKKAEIIFLCVKEKKIYEVEEYCMVNQQSKQAVEEEESAKRGAQQVGLCLGWHGIAGFALLRKDFFS